jgi:hypothetical protein
MTIAVIAASVVLVILGLFVVALVYSYAGLHRRLEELDQGTRARSAVSSSPASTAFRPAADLLGVTPSGEGAVVAVVGAPQQILLAFLSSGCSSCRRFFDDLAVPGRVALPADVRLVVVTKGPAEESPSAVAAMAPPGQTVVMSSEAWLNYEVPGSPYFVLVDGPAAGVLGGGTGPGWREVLDLLALATGDVADRGHQPRRQREAEREAMIDEVLLGAGIGPGHPSLYPAGNGEGAPRPAPSMPEDP